MVEAQSSTRVSPRVHWLRSFQYSYYCWFSVKGFVGMSTNGFTCLSVLSTTSCCTNKQSDSRSGGSGNRQVLPGQVEVDRWQVSWCHFYLKPSLIHGPNDMILMTIVERILDRQLFKGTAEWKRSHFLPCRPRFSIKTKSINMTMVPLNRSPRCSNLKGHSDERSPKDRVKVKIDKQLPMSGNLVAYRF